MLVKRRAFTEDIAAVRALWYAAFPTDSEEQRELFLSAFFPQYCYVAALAGEPIAMVFGLPAMWHGQPLQYIYAAATLPAHRSRGVFGELLRYALDEARTQGCRASFLHPAQPSLDEYYARFGYRPWSVAAVQHGTAGHAVPISVLSPAQYSAARAALLPDGAIHWPADCVQYAVRAADGGGAFAWGHSIALCEPSDGVLYIKEQWGADNPADLCAALGYTAYVAVREADTLVLPFCDEEFSAPYVGLVLD